MDRPVPPPPHRPRLLAAACALVLTAAFLGGVRLYVHLTIPRMLPFYSAHAVSIKIGGTLLQSAAFRTPDELPIYGSSELGNWIPNRADAFFRHRPTGFAVFLVGRGGGSCLSILQKLAAAGPAARGKRVMIFLSPAWFVENVEAAALDTDLGVAQLGAWVFGDALSPPLKRAVAARMQEFPDKVKNQELLDAALRSLAAGPRLPDRLGYGLLAPLGRFQNALLESIESCAVLWEAADPRQRWLREGRRDQPPPPLAEGRIDWPQLGPGVVGADRTSLRVRDLAGPRRLVPDQAGSPNAFFLARLASTPEFDDLALLIRVLREMRMEACFIGQPFNGAFRDQTGIGTEARQVYYRRLEAVLRASGYPWHDFAEHEYDDAFFADLEHPSAQAWLIYDREIDRFCAGGE